MVRWPTDTLFTGLREATADAPDRPALVFRGDETTYRELLDRARSLAGGLADLGIGEGDVVAVWVANRPEWIELQLALNALGAQMVAVNTRYRRHELEYMLADAGCSMLVTERSFLDIDYFDILAASLPAIETADPADFAAEGFPALEHVVAIEGSDEYPAIRDFESVAARGPDDVRPVGDGDATAALFYTSGTTGDPKGVMQTNRSLLNHSYRVGEHLGVDASDVAIGLLPFCGILGYNYLFSALTHGMPIVVQTHFDAERSAELIADHDVTYLNAVPTMYERLLDADGFVAGETAASVRRAVVTFMNGYDEAQFDRFESAFGAPFVQPYGLSEANSQVFAGDPTDDVEDRKLVGGPLVNPEETEARIVDPDTGEELPAGREGELQLRGYIVMDGYLNKPEETAEALSDDGWLATGDLAHRDERGYFYYHARLGDALRVRGFLVSPAEIEGGLQEVEGVEAAQVVGVDHDEYGDVPVAFVIRADDALTAEELSQRADDRMADYKVPAAIEFVDEFPMTEGPNGLKVQKTKLRDRATELVEN